MPTLSFLLLTTRIQDGSDDESTFARQLQRPPRIYYTQVARITGFAR